MSKKKKEKGPDFIVKKAIQDFARKNNMMVGSDAYDAINSAIGDMMKDAAARCKSNKRKTLKAYDF
jgi:histone H3/H4